MRVSVWQAGLDVVQRDFRLGEWVVRPQRDCIDSRDETIHVTPKSMGVLGCLAGAEGGVVSRNDILDTVWPGAEVTDDVLTHSVTELRKAFGDTAHDSHVIETIPKKGLRLLPDVVWVDEADSAAEAGNSLRGVGSKPVSRRLALFVLATVIVGASVWTYLSDRGRVPLMTGDAISVAVRPFVDLSENQDQQHLAMGFSQELALRLSGIDGLNVAGPRPPAESLTDFVLDGSVRRFGDELRVSVLLVDVRNGLQVWSHRFDSEFSEIFETQDRVANGVAMALSVKLDVGQESFGHWRTANPDAYEEMLRGNQHFDLTPAGLEQAARHYTRATAIDPDYVMAWQRLAEVNNVASVMYDGPERRDRRQIAEAAAAKALELAPESHEALLVATEVAFSGQDWFAARRYYDRALESGAVQVNEAYASIGRAHVHFAMLFKLGYVEEQIRLLEKVYRLKPLGGTYAQFLPQAYLAAGRYEEALAEVERAYPQEWARVWVSNVALSVALSIGDEDLILYWLERVIDQSPARPDGVLHNMHRLFGDRDQALEYLRSRAGSGSFFDYYALKWASYYQDYELALDVMRRRQDLWNFWVPLHAPVRSTEAFKELVTDMGLVDYWREYGWGDYCQPIGAADFQCR